MTPTRDEARPKAPKARADWIKARNAEIQYGVQLRKIARHIGELIKGHAIRTAADAYDLVQALKRYADLLDPWAKAQASRMVLEIAARSDKEWKRASVEMGRDLRKAVFAYDPIGVRYRELMAEQVSRIKSLPLDAAIRVQKVATEGVIEGLRFTEVAKTIEEGGEVSKSKAKLIARTETGRVVTALTQARAESVGSSGYTWRTMQDAQVRPSHKAMEGKFVAWDDPPTLDGLTGHAGSLPNCRCYAEPVIPLQ